MPHCKSHLISFLTTSVEFPLCHWVVTPYYLHVLLHYYHKSLPAGRKFPQATVRLTWQQFPDSSFEMFATLSVTANKLKQQSVIFNGYLYQSPHFMSKFCGPVFPTKHNITLSSWHVSISKWKAVTSQL